MKHLLILLALLLAGPAHAGGAIASAPVGGPKPLAAKATWTSPCLAVIPPFDVYAATTAPASLSVQRFADKACVFAIGAASPLPAHALAQSNLCLAHGYCGDQGTPDLTPFSALTISITDTSGAPNTILGVQLTQDPPDRAAFTGRGPEDMAGLR